jgi:hypothetical protein
MTRANSTRIRAGRVLCVGALCLSLSLLARLARACVPYPQQRPGPLAHTSLGLLNSSTHSYNSLASLRGSRGSHVQETGQETGEQLVLRRATLSCARKTPLLLSVIFWHK